jgi:arginase family enzyme
VTLRVGDDKHVHCRSKYDVIGTEVDPIYDAAGVTPRIAAKLLLDVLGGAFAK